MVNESDLRLDYLVDPSIQLYQDPRSEERRVGKECGS